MTSYVSIDLRRLVESRANHLCEYCLIHADDTYLGCQVDHIISEKHGGPTEAENLAYACTFCNRSKGTDIGSIELDAGELTRFYNPRIDRWADHFSLDGVDIKPRTAIGRVTAKILGFNEAERILERKAIQEVGRYPPAESTDLLTESEA